MTTFLARVIILIVLASSLVAVYVVPSYLDSATASQYLRVHFLAVGQGDAILLETHDDVQMLVDAGRDRRVLSQLGKHMSPYDRTLDMVVMTHPDSDHVGGMDEVFARFSVDTLLTTEVKGSDLITSRIEEEVAAQDNLSTYFARAGMEFQLGASTTVSVLSPTYNPTGMERNASSIVLHIHYGDTSLLLTGDASVAIEEYLVSRYQERLASDVLKLGHHGSNTSSGRLFLETVAADFAVISAGADNQYGHPAPAVLERMLQQGMFPVSTQIDTSITFVSNGDRVWVEY